ncbi:MAG: hypothetical protein HY064_01170 [Bacteroidetes bacterium]|nr:hypothetical protein [Bacteroidota bacterium]
MKFYKYPLSLVAYAVLFVFAASYGYHRLGKMEMAHFWYLFPACAAGFIFCSFVLSKITMPWELDVILQVAIVLAPVLYIINQREEYRQPVFIFVMEPGYHGTLQIHFNTDKNAPMNARSTADTVYFRFDEYGRILLNEEALYVQKMMKKNLFIFYPDHTKQHIPFVDKNRKPDKNFEIVVMEDSAVMKKGRMDAIYYSVNNSR